VSETNPMSIKTFLEVAETLSPEISVLIRSDHGKGKSRLVRQLARRLAARDKLDSLSTVIDKRLAQMTEGDLVGLPVTDGGMTRFNPPDWYHECCNTAMTLFLDELNRATGELLQGAFQIVLDRELNGHKLHKQTRVYAAVNTGAKYTVNEMDPALLDRFFIVDLVPTVEDWLEWAASSCEDLGSWKFGKENVTPVIREFIRQGPTWLDPPKEAGPTDCCTSRRSWERNSDAIVQNQLENDPSNPLFYSLTMGFSGTEAAIKLREFAITFDVQVSAEDVLERWCDKSMISRMAAQSHDGLNDIIERLAEHIINNVTELNKSQAANLRAFMMMLPGELRVSCWSKITRKGSENMRLARSIHSACGDTLLETFGVPKGEAGVGVVPQVDGIFEKQKNEQENE